MSNNLHYHRLTLQYKAHEIPENLIIYHSYTNMNKFSWFPPQLLITVVFLVFLSSVLDGDL